MSLEHQASEFQPARSRAPLLCTASVLIIAFSGESASQARRVIEGAEQDREAIAAHHQDLRTELLRITDALRRDVSATDVLRDRASSWRAFERVWDAGLSENRAFVVPLVEIAETAASTRHSGLSFVALKALMLLGEPHEYLESLIEQYATNPALAVMAMRALATDPQETRTARFFEVATEAERRLPQDAAMKIAHEARAAEQTLQYSIRNRSLPTLGERVDHLAPWAAKLNDILGISGGEPRQWRRVPFPVETEGSQRIWAREECARLSLQQPKEFAIAFANARLVEYTSSSDSPEERSRRVRLIKESASSFLAPECLAIWRSLEPPEEEVNK